MSDTRLIERWLPIAALGEESVRERRFSMAGNALPPNNSLHVWWARRPLVASRAAILASLLPADADMEKFLHALGIHGDPVAAQRAIVNARRTGQRIPDPFTWKRAFRYSLNSAENDWIEQALGGRRRTILDPTAGGGSIPFEAARVGQRVLANDLNPVAALVMKATIQWPTLFGSLAAEEFRRIAATFRKRLGERLATFYPQREAPERLDLTYLWARTIRCPYCDGRVPMSPNWRLAPNGTGVRLLPNCEGGPGTAGRVCHFEIVSSVSEQSSGTVEDGDATCPFPDCGRVIDGEQIKEQARVQGLGEQLYAIVFRQRIETRTKSGKRGRDKWERGYRSPEPEDDISEVAKAHLIEKSGEWQALDILPTEAIPDGFETGPLHIYGQNKWLDLFNPRQTICHCYAVEVFRDILQEEEEKGSLSELTRAALTYLALSIDKIIDYSSRQVTWHAKREVMDHTFRVHGFRLRWSHAEMSPLIPGLGYDWAIEQTATCVEDLVGLVGDDLATRDLLSDAAPKTVRPDISISCKSGDVLDHIENASVDVVVMDPPYYDNVMYAELSDFFYVWLKRTAGRVVPELFTRQLTDKENEAVANPAKFEGQKGAKKLAGRDYQDRMARIFEECRRVLKPDGIMTLMFTHKATGAWDALTTGLMHAGFTISASWPINTEAEGSLHIKDKSAANSTIFLVCRPRAVALSQQETSYWEDVEPLVARAVRERVAEFQKGGITGVDLYLASFGPALEEFSRHWPLRRGTPRPQPEALRRRKQAEMFEEAFDPYAVTPEDALEAARREVKRWRLEQLTHMKASTELDPLTSWFVLAWDAFRAPVFPYDEALRLARAVGVDLDAQIVGVLAEKKGSDLVLWDSARRAAKGALGPSDGSRAMVDAIHHAANVGRTRTLQAAREMLEKAKVDTEPSFFAALEAVLEVLPVSTTFSGIDLDGDLASAGSDFEALENLRKLAFADQVDEPKQLDLWREAEAA
ncbi:DUF1156 domain-containing protein [Microvirga roseola]|uniref:DUF1156 domain-containing protein n=1 Tax=Microvirga roseola TaxID=2883126 RepID=UPI001E3C4E07|nr:DUF1156 domain-containing protein [Microvirga roseola]